MKSLGFTYSSSLKNNAIHIYNQRLISHEQIIDLHDILLTPGFHCLSTNNIVDGRLMIDILLMSLNYFHNISCLTTDKKGFPGPIHNIYKDLEQGDYLNQGSDGIERFLLDFFHYDFLLIEMQPTLIKSNWLPLFQQKLIDLGIDQAIPIIYLLYESN